MKTNPLYHMKNKLLAANWKSNKTKFEAKDWLIEVADSGVPPNLDVVIFPPFTLLDLISGYVKVNSLPFKVGAQDVSPFEGGAYTGEVSAKQIEEFCDYVIIGHSERRKNFNEGKEMVLQKIKKAEAEGLSPIVCISELNELEGLESGKAVIAYEPLASIGTGNAEDPKAVEDFAAKIRQVKNNTIIYGGSVGPDNIKNYLSIPLVEGVLVGSASLDAAKFIDLIKNAS